MGGILTGVSHDFQQKSIVPGGELLARRSFPNNL